MAHVPGLHPRDGVALLTLLLLACRSPISNLPFEEEAAFLSALPAATTWSSPRELVLAPLGDDPVLRAAKEAAGRWDAWVEGPVTLGEALRSREPDVRTDVARRWERLEVVANYTGAALGGEEPRRLWLEAEVVRLEDGSFQSSIAAAPDEASPAAEVSVLERDEDASIGGWNLDALFAAFEVDEAPGPMNVILYESGLFEGARRLQGSVGAGPGAETWFHTDLDRLGFSADLALTTDDLSWPATVESVVVPEAGGRAAGVVFRGTDELGFDACWDAAGDTVFVGGDEGIRRQGDATACAN